MIIDGRKVLYTMKGGVIQDPSIPTDGLVCYLDTREKTNTDKHRGTLLDLSGNGNHGTLQNFIFTEESGYAKDLSGEGASGLRFDGIDDNLLISTSYVAGDPFTQFIDFEIEYTANTQGVYIRLGSIYIHPYDDYIILMDSDSFAYIDKEIPAGRYQLCLSTVCLSTDRNHLGLNAWINGEKCAIGDASDYTFKDTYLFSPGGKIIYKYAFWNRMLTDEEIQQLMEE